MYCENCGKLDVEEIKTASDKLRDEFYKISEKLYQGAAAAANATGTTDNADEPKQGTVHDADYKVEE